MRRREDVVVGETPNLAARLQQVAAPNTVVVSSTTRRRLGRMFELRLLGSVVLKGFADAVTFWEVVGEAMVESSLSPPRTSVPARSGRPRSSELSPAHAAMAVRARRRRPARVLSGQPGIGKSRLAGTLCARVAAEPHVRVVCQCSPHHTDSPFYPVLRMVERSARIQPTDTATRKPQKLRALLRVGWGQTRMAPLLANLLSITDDLPPDLAMLDPVVRKQQMLAMLAEMLSELSRRQPVLLLIEDAHWIDPSNHDLFRQIARAVNDSAIPSCSSTCGPREEALWSSYPDATRLQLSGLDRRSAMLLVEATADEHVDYAGAFDGTHPEEMRWRAVVHRGVDQGVARDPARRLDHGRSRSAVRRCRATSTFRPTLHNSLMARLDRLSAWPSRWPRSAPSIGREFAYELLAAV